MAEPQQSEIARLELLFAAHPEGRVFAHLAEAYRRAGELERARALLEAGLERHADYASAHVVHGRVLLDLGLEAEAEVAFRRVLALDPENLVALRALGDLARRAGRTAEALDYYEQLRRRDSTNPEIEAVVAALAAEAPQADAPAQAEAAAEVGVLVEDAPAPDLAGAEAETVAEDVDGFLTPAEEAEGFRAEDDPGTAASWEDFTAMPTWEESAAVAAEDPTAASADFDAEATEPVEPAAAVEFPAAAEEPAPADESEVLGGEMVTETLADLYLSQGLAERAATLYRQLLIMRPGDPRLMERLEQALAASQRNGQHARPRDAESQTEAPADAAGAAASGPEPDVAAQPDAGADDEWAALDLEAERLTEVEAAWTGGEAAGTESVSPYTWQEEARPAATDAQAEPTIRAYFERLMAWEPTEGALAAAAGSPDAPPATPVDENFDALFTPAVSVEPPVRAAAAAEPRPIAPAEMPEPAAAAGALVGLADLLVGLLEYHDPAMPGGSGLVRQVATAIGRELGMAEPPLRSLALAAVLQGIGRLALRRRPGGDAARATEPDARALAVTLDLLDGLDLPSGVREAIAHVNHRWDGAGGVELAGASIPLSARILAVARDFAALLAPSAVEHARRVQAALDELRREAGRRYDPGIVDALVRLVGSQARIGFGLRHHVVIVHRHSPTAAVIAARLRSSGYLPEAVDDIARAWERLASTPADALLLADDVGDADVPHFLARLREDHRLGGIPVIVAGADALERRVQLLNAGADVCFPGDVSFNELHATLTALLRRAARSGAAADAARRAAGHARYALQGDLVDFPLTWLLDILAFDGRTAVISVAAPDDEGTVYVERGAPRHAETRSRYGEAALQAMLQWRRGTFSVHLDAPPVPQTIHRAVVDLLVSDGPVPGERSDSPGLD